MVQIPIESPKICDFGDESIAESAQLHWIENHSMFIGGFFEGNLSVHAFQLHDLSLIEYLLI